MTCATMRTLIAGFVVIFAALVLAVLPILFAGRAMLYTLAPGRARTLDRPL